MSLFYYDALFKWNNGPQNRMDALSKMTIEKLKKKNRKQQTPAMSAFNESYRMAIVIFPQLDISKKSHVRKETVI